MAEAEAGPPRLERGADGRATITLNRPQHLNRLHREDLAALQAHFAAVAADPTVRVVVLAGKGRAFCAGFNLDELNQADAAGSDPQAFERMVEALAALPQVTVARLNGGVYGGATDLALACDFRIGVDTMELRMPAVRLGLHYYPSGLQRAVAKLGLQAAKRLFLLGRAMDAAALRQIGWLDDAVPADALDTAVDGTVAALLAGAPLALLGMKRSLDEIARGDFELGRVREREAACAASADLREGMAAMAERRPPRFSGR